MNKRLENQPITMEFGLEIAPEHITGESEPHQAWAPSLEVDIPTFKETFTGAGTVYTIKVTAVFADAVNPGACADKLRAMLCVCQQIACRAVRAWPPGVTGCDVV
jgi:hypothetical protein